MPNPERIENTTVEPQTNPQVFLAVIEDQHGAYGNVDHFLALYREAAVKAAAGEEGLAEYPWYQGWPTKSGYMTRALMAGLAAQHSWTPGSMALLLIHRSNDGDLVLLEIA